MFDSISTTKTDNRVLEVNLYNCVACRECFVIPLPTFYKPMMPTFYKPMTPTFYKPMIKVQMPLYKTDGAVLTRLCTWNLHDIYAHALGPQLSFISVRKAILKGAYAYSFQNYTCAVANS